ncbi:TPA: hypothetical protein ACKF4R_004323 [Citrobacter amalonaticus]
MTTITRERLLKIQQWRETYGPGSNVVLPAEEAEELARIALASLESEPVAWTDADELRDAKNGGSGYMFAIGGDANKFADPRRQMMLYAAPPAPEDYFSSLVSAARLRAGKAMRKFPQPNYVLNKVAEESGEVIKEVIHYTEGRGDWNKVEYELIDNLAMLIRLVTEGDQVIGFTPPDVCRGAKGSQPVSNRDELLATQQQQNAQQNIPNNIPGGLIEAVNDLLNNDGSRGRYSAIGCGNAREKIELWLSQRQKWESQRDKNISAGNSPVIPDSSEDTKRLDWLDYQNKRLNEYYGTAYGWKFDANFQRNAMMLNDSNYPVMTVRQAIDQAIASAQQQEVNRE